ncbi:DUF397 domain-containing protein [Streptomyces pratensis]|uniref:DUF397 domain-containing protein n=1 Tax=Streptomyces pratensis TaxID=1169025 RepID=UPI001932EA6B|nr:DUF397 domain-containing protein [Streptomyces pratensis]
MTRASTEIPDCTWFKSSYSGGNETECVEAAFTDGGTSVRDSTRPHGERFHVPSAAWSDFVCSVRSGRLG